MRLADFHFPAVNKIQALVTHKNGGMRGFCLPRRIDRRENEVQIEMAQILEVLLHPVMKKVLRIINR